MNFDSAGMRLPFASAEITPLTLFVSPTASLGRSTPTSCSRILYRAALPSGAVTNRYAAAPLTSGSASPDAPVFAGLASADSRGSHAARDAVTAASRMYWVAAYLIIVSEITIGSCGFAMLSARTLHHLRSHSRAGSRDGSQTRQEAS